ncbi:MAG: mitochondrial 2-enoyl thioester reductase [Thelocarpon impressellum]|nr:MAG: mitochondrial 2-enoyl thioester reductase [Thelocarpon impressellum]
MLRPSIRPRHSIPIIPHRRCISAYGYTQAKALVYSQHGEPADVLKLHGHSISPAHSSQVTLRFLASPINPADINQIQGVYPSKPPFTQTLGTPSPAAVAGNEGVAEVLSTGSSVKSVCKGDWVLMRSTCFGTWRTHAQADESELLKIDKTGLSPVQAGTVSVNPCTAYRMLKDFAPLRPGDCFIQNGANSGVGRAAIQLGRLWGLKSINVIRARPDTDSLKDELHALGADVVLTEQDLSSRGLSSSLPAAPKLGLDCVGGAPTTALAKLLSPGSPLVTYGAMAKQPLRVPPSLLIFRDIRFAGFWVSAWADRNPEGKCAMVAELLRLVREGRLRDAPVREVRWLPDTPEATLKEAVQGGLEGFRGGKGVFVFPE